MGNTGDLGAVDDMGDRGDLNDSGAGRSILVEHFARKATATGATVRSVATAAAAEELVGRESGDHVSRGVFAVAETGSVALAASTKERAACFLAERLWLLVGAADIVATLDEALARVAQMVSEERPYVTLMTGPSRTADIERTLTIGVHGPRELHVLVVGDESSS